MGTHTYTDLGIVTPGSHKLLQNGKSVKNEEQTIMKRRTFISKMNIKAWRHGHLDVK